MTHKSTWKAMERKVAAKFGSKRTPLSGSNGGVTASDSLHPVLFLEAKLRAKHAAWELWQDTAAKAKKENKVPVVALKQKGGRGELYVIHGDHLREVLEALLKVDAAVNDEKPLL